MNCVSNESHKKQLGDPSIDWCSERVRRRWYGHESKAKESRSNTRASAKAIEEVHAELRQPMSTITTYQIEETIRQTLPCHNSVFCK